MKRSYTWLSALCAGFLTGVVLAPAAQAATHEDFVRLKAELDNLNKQVNAKAPVTAKSNGRVDTLVDKKLDDNNSQAATTRVGRLQVGGLMQVWYYSIQNDSKGWVDVQKATLNPQFYGGSNEVNDNDSFRVRRAEINFKADINENVTGVIMMDPARITANAFPTFPSNLGNQASGDGVATWDYGVAQAGAVGAVTPAANLRTAAVRNDFNALGQGQASRLLQDAYINVHGILPHHDVTSGQFRPQNGEEGSRDNSKLDFAERAMITQLGELRDVGSQIHGTWFSERLQYWVGMFAGSGTAYQQHQNRANDNDGYDFLLAMKGRPVWKNDTWGSLEVGFSIKTGSGGEAAGSNPGDAGFAVNGLNQRNVKHHLAYAYASYMPGGPVKGWWLRGEVGSYRDRFAPGQVGGGIIDNPAPFTVKGGYFATGYKLSESIWQDKCPAWLKPVEFVGRYETMQNLYFPDEPYTIPTRVILQPSGPVTVSPYVSGRQDVFSTRVATLGFNYYIKGHNAKFQLNYNWVSEEDPSRHYSYIPTTTFARELRSVSNNNLVANFQVAW